MKDVLSKPALKGNNDLDRYFKLLTEQYVFIVLNEKLECSVVE